MRTNILTIAILVQAICVSSAFAQSIAAYGLTAQISTYTPLNPSVATTPGLSSGNANEGVYADIPIGFDFFYLNERFTKLYASTNGWIALTSNPVSSPLASNSFFTFSLPANVIAPLWDDIDLSSGSFRYQTTGTAPNRIFIAEWFNAEWNWNTNTPVISFQVKLFETSGAIQFEYRQEAGAVAGGSATIGIRGFDGSNFTFLSLTNTGNNPGINSTSSVNNLNTKPANGQTYRFQPNAVNAPTSYSANSITINSMNINWVDNASNESGFVIYRSTDNTNFIYTGFVSANTNTFQVTGLVSGTTYTYRIHAINQGRLSTPLTGSTTTTAGTLSGTLNIPGNYATLTAALNALRASGLSGNVTLQLNTNYNSALETYPINISGIGTANNRRLLIRPAANVTQLTINAGNNQAINIINTNFVTIDGRPGGIGSTRALTITATTSTSTIVFGDDCSNDTLRFCNISLNDNGQNSFSNSSVISFQAFNFGFFTGSNQNAITNNDIFGINPPACLIQFSTSNNFSGQDATSTGNTFSNNLLHDYLGLFTFNNGNSAINISGKINSFNISNNSIYQTNSVSTTSFNNFFQLSGIRVSGQVINNLNIANNFIGGSAPNCGGGPYEVGPVNEFNCIFGIDVNGNNITNTSINGNTIRNFLIGSSASFSGIPAFSGIKFQGFRKSNATISNNNIGTDTGNTSIQLINEGGFTQYAIGIMADAADTSLLTINNNKIGGFSLNGATQSDGHFFIGIYGATSGSITNNLIGSLTTSNSIRCLNTATLSNQTLVGISNSALNGFASRNEQLTISGNTVSGMNNIFNNASNADKMIGIEVTDAASLTLSLNTIQNLSSSHSSSNILTSTFKGIQVNNNSATTASGYIIQTNTVRNLFANNSSGVNSITGLQVNTISSVNNTISRNFIHSFTTNSPNQSAQHIGIYLSDGQYQVSNNKIRLGITGTGASMTQPITIAGIDNNSSDPVDIWHNTIYVGGSLAASSVNTYCLRQNSNGLMNVTNNILVNVRNFTASLAKRNLCIGLSSPAQYSGNTNCFFKQGIGSALGEVSSQLIDTITLWRNLTSGDAASGVVNPSLINPTGNTNTLDLHVSGVTPIEGNGINLPLVSVDFDGQLRSSFTPNDIGADAGNFTSTALPVTWGQFTATAENNSAVLSFNTLTERNTSHFEIERSSDRETFTFISRLEAKGNSNIPVNYRFTDREALSNATTLYYRIKQVDQNGDFSYSIIRTVKANADETLALLPFPNPCNETLYIDTKSTLDVLTYQITNLQGSVVKTGQINNQNKQGIDTRDLPAGIYIIGITELDKRVKFVRQ